MALPSAAENEETAFYNVCKSFPSTKVLRSIKSCPILMFITWEPLTYCGGFVKCQFGQAELHFPESLLCDVSRATGKISVRDLKGESETVAVLCFVLSVR